MSSGGVVLLDFDGTLAHRSGRWSQCLVDALDSVVPDHGVTADDLRPHLRSGYPWHRHDESHPELCDPDVWWARMAEPFSEAYRAVGIAAEHARPAAAAVRELYCDHRQFHLFDDTRPALAELRAAGWSLVVVSNHVPELGSIVDGLGLSPLLDAVHTSARTGYEKPHPEAYRIGLGSFAPESAWMVGDNPVADVAGAEALGIRGVLVRRPDVDDPVVRSTPNLADAVALITASR